MQLRVGTGEKAACSLMMTEACRARGGWWLESKPRSDLDEARAGSRSDNTEGRGTGLGANRRRRTTGARRIEADHVEGIRGFTANLEDEALEVDVAEDAQIDVAVTGRAQIVAGVLPSAPPGPMPPGTPGPLATKAAVLNHS